MIRFYFHPTPNPAKIALFLEEAGLPYEAIPIDTSKGEQHSPSFRTINPNGKVPVRLFPNLCESPVSLPQDPFSQKIILSPSKH